jgi:cysteine desulfurase/selenocysteine lyase
VTTTLPHSTQDDFRKDFRQDFPILSDRKICYLDSGASTQKPRVVIDGMKEFYETSYSNVHRGIYPLAEQATQAYEQAREKVADFINSDMQEVVFTRSTTDGINMFARSIMRALQPGDEVLVTDMEHHSNFVPWQQLAKQYDISFNIVKITPDDALDMEDLRSKVSMKTKVIAVTHVSNVLGTINPIREIADIAHNVGAVLIVDGAQAIAHLPVDVKELDCDAYAFSGHKMYGPEAIGVLYAKKGLLESLEPSTWGGEMVMEVTASASTWNDLPYKFEPGTPNITQAVGLGYAIDYLRAIGMQKVYDHEHELLSYAHTQLQKIPQLHVIGPRFDEKNAARVGIITFLLDGVHPHDIAQLLADKGVCVRAGHHCAHPLHCAKALPATTRASFGIYTTKEDIDRFVSGIQYVLEVFK